MNSFHLETLVVSDGQLFDEATEYPSYGLVPEDTVTVENVSSYAVMEDYEEADFEADVNSICHRSNSLSESVVTAPAFATPITMVGEGFISIPQDDGEADCTGPLYVSVESMLADFKGRAGECTLASDQGVESEERTYRLVDEITVQPITAYESLMDHVTRCNRDETHEQRLNRKQSLSRMKKILQEELSEDRGYSNPSGAD